MGSRSLHLHLPLSPSPCRPPSRQHNPLLLFQPNPNYNIPFRSTSSISASTSSPSDGNDASRWLHEEQRWLREEQRWLREEQRWIREESRWNSERESLLREIASLREKLQSIERRGSDPGKVEVLLKALNDRIPPPVLVEEADVKEMILEEAAEKVGAAAEKVVAAAAEEEEEEEEVEEEEEEEDVEERRTLGKGTEGEDVKAMQDALESFGFYSGEEDSEYHMFSDGTERAVKAWQASLGVREDGVMSPELQKRLFSQPIEGHPRLEASIYGKDETNGAPAVSAPGISEPQHTVRKDSVNEDEEVSPRRVYLIGENRWEEPSRLVEDKPLSGSENISLVKCLACRGEGRLMCTECDGTGEPNIEPQFMEWIDEGAKCPYCEGLGYTICDVCEGKTMVEKDKY